MAGGEGPLRRRTAKGVEAAAAGPPAPLRKCSATKRKKALGKAAASGRTPRPRASGSKTKEETAAAEAVAGAKPQKRRLPAKDVRWILAQETKAPPAIYQDLKRRNPDLVPLAGAEDDEELVGLYVLARAAYQLQDKFPKLQDWVRGELKEKGYVEVEEEWFESTAEAQKVIDREWPGIRAMMDDLCLEEGGADESESDSDEAQGEDRVDVLVDFNEE